MNGKTTRIIICLLLLVLCLPGAVPAAEPPTEPILRIETGMHTAVIRRISVDRENRLFATASDDKTIRLWDAGTGELLRIIRPPVGDVQEGRLYAVAIAPDGKTIAAGGWTQFNQGSNTAATDGHTIYLFDIGTGRLLRRLTGLPNVINHLVFSRDGRHLAACLGRNNGIRIYRTSDYSLAGEDKDYGSDSYGADFDPTGGLVTTSYDGYLRRYDVRFRLVAKEKAPGGTQPYAVRFSPDGREVAVGFDDTTALNVLSEKDLAFRFAPDTQGVGNGNLFSVSWSADGRRLYAGGKYQKQIAGRWKCLIRTWSDGGRGGYLEIPAPDNTILDLQPRQGGGVFFGAFDPAFGAFDCTGNALYTRNPVIGDYRDNWSGFQVSPDGAVVRFAYEVFGKSPAFFSLAERRLTTGATVPDGVALAASRTHAPGLTVTDWKHTTSPKLNGAPLKLEQYEMSRSLAVVPDGRTFLLGADWYLRLFNTRGEEIWKAPVPGAAWAVNISGDGRFALAALGDGTIRWYNIKDGKEVLAFFPHRDQKRWVLWTPSGYYDAASGAEELIGWHVNQGKNQAADFFPASRFRAVYYRPDVLARILETGDEKEAIRLADAESGRKRQEVAVSQMLPPVATILSPEDNAAVSHQTVNVRYSLRSPSGEAITAVRFLVDGRPVSANRGLAIVPKGEAVQEATIAVPAQDCEISVIAENRYAAGVPATVRLRWAGKSDSHEFMIKPKLYVLAVGVSQYPDKDLRLAYAAKDANDFARVMQSQEGKLYRQATVKVITDNKATKEDILDGLDWLQKETTSKDVAIIFIAGHGLNDPAGIYYYLPVNIDLERLKRTGVAFSDIKNTVSSLAGKAVLFVDTCHAGNVMGKRRAVADINAVVNELASAENGAVVFASSTGKQYSLEDKAWGNGAFTKALVEGIGGRADYKADGKITINELDLYLSERVKELTKGQQTPTTTKPETIPDFPIAVAR